MASKGAQASTTRAGLTIRPFEIADRDSVTALWQRCGLVVPYNPPETDIALCVETPSSELFVGMVENTVRASVMAGSDGHRGWLYYLAVAPESRGQGFGRQLVRHAESWLSARGIRKVHLMIRETNLDVQQFYKHIGYTENPCPVLQRWLVDPYAG